MRALMNPRLLFIVLASLTAAACGPSELKIVMNEDNGSGQSGEALLTDAADGTVVVLTLAKGNATGPQFGHVHPGKCGELSGPRYPLTNVVDGTSTTKLVDGETPVRLSQLLETPLAINIHSAADPGVYVSCGNIK